MPGFEVIGAEEFNEVKDVFDKGGVLFRHGFDNLRNYCLLIYRQLLKYQYYFFLGNLNFYFQVEH